MADAAPADDAPINQETEEKTENDVNVDAIPNEEGSPQAKDDEVKPEHNEEETEQSEATQEVVPGDEDNAHTEQTDELKDPAVEDGDTGTVEPAGDTENVNVPDMETTEDTPVKQATDSEDVPAEQTAPTDDPKDEQVVDQHSEDKDSGEQKEISADTQAEQSNTQEDTPAEQTTTQEDAPTEHVEEQNDGSENAPVEKTVSTDDTLAVQAATPENPPAALEDPAAETQAEHTDAPQEQPQEGDTGEEVKTDLPKDETNEPKLDDDKEESGEQKPEENKDGDDDKKDYEKNEEPVVEDEGTKVDDAVEQTEVDANKGEGEESTVIDDKVETGESKADEAKEGKVEEKSGDVEEKQETAEVEEKQDDIAADGEGTKINEVPEGEGESKVDDSVKQEVKTADVKEAPKEDGEKVEVKEEESSKKPDNKETAIVDQPAAPIVDGAVTAPVNRPGSRGSRASRRSIKSRASQDKLKETPVPPTPPPVPEKAKSPEEIEPVSSIALSMAWSFGMSRQIPVLNLSNASRQAVLYVCAHTCVMYNYEKNRQTLLHGHGNAITCTCVSEDKRWLASGDQGKDHVIIVWDTDTGIPVRTIFNPYPERGVAAITMTPDAKYIATLSCGSPQTLSVWDWTVEGESPLCSVDLSPDYGVQHHILFNPEDSSQLVTNSDHQVIFYQWQVDDICYSAPPLTDEDFNKPVGRYSQTIFQSDCNRALTATSIGNLVVWDMNTHTEKEIESVTDKRALKLVRLQEKGLNILTTTNGHIVTGDVAGHIKFFDQKLKLLNWYQDFQLGPVNAVTFAHVPDFSEAGADSKYPPDATIAAKQFALRDFVIGTATAVYGRVNTDGTDVKIIHRDHDAAVHALTCHPSKPYMVVGSYSGLLKIWDYEMRETVVSRSFDRGLMIQCCAIDPQGVHIALGFTNGSVRILDAFSLDDVVTPYRYARDAITHITFSHDSAFLATADADFTVTLFRSRHGEGVIPWAYVGRHRSHYQRITELMFDVKLDSNDPRLLSLGEDRYLIEYDLETSSKDDLRLSSSDRIEQSAIPTFMASHPPVTKESFIVTANDQYKFKLYNSTTKKCRQTSLGPCFGNPIQRLLILPSEDALVDKQYLAFITTDKIGLQILPLDGNPHNAMALTAHPQQVVNLACSYDGKYLFTAGGCDACVHMWKINIEALEAAACLGGQDLIPFYGLLDGGREGELFRELEDYFYYAQIRSQGVNTMAKREASTHIPLNEVPFVMRAMGFYPSEQEIEDMLNEVKFSTYVETGTFKADIDLGEFIRLYINHRPAFGLEADKLDWVFNTLGIPIGDGKPAIERGEMLDILQKNGEHMSEYELAEYLTTLLGYNAEGGSCEQQEFDPTYAGDIIEENLASNITASTFANELLNFGMYADILNLEDIDYRQGTGTESRKTAAM